VDCLSTAPATYHPLLHLDTTPPPPPTDHAREQLGISRHTREEPPGLRSPTLVDERSPCLQYAPREEAEGVVRK